MWTLTDRPEFISRRGIVPDQFLDEAPIGGVSPGIDECRAGQGPVIVVRPCAHDQGVSIHAYRKTEVVSIRAIKRGELLDLETVGRPALENIDRSRAGRCSAQVHCHGDGVAADRNRIAELMPRCKIEGNEFLELDPLRGEARGIRENVSRPGVVAAIIILRRWRNNFAMFGAMGRTRAQRELAVQLQLLSPPSLAAGQVWGCRS